MYSFSSLPMKRFALTTLSGVTAGEACMAGSVLRINPNNASLQVQETSSGYLRSRGAEQGMSAALKDHLLKSGGSTVNQAQTVVCVDRSVDVSNLLLGRQGCQGRHMNATLLQAEHLRRQDPRLRPPTGPRPPHKGLGHPRICM